MNDLLPVMWGHVRVYFDDESKKFYATIEINNKKVLFESFKGEIR
jgi:hypothetical protein